ncbi:hypothetical protein [Secundilactobacillus similis]|uniref:hypothetical protein n=1 Tax=Secundilactobacillus similis TaxID=414682 RepID=UPI0006CFDF61|nr:hypothetical protein [Secundilactobacillus similis]
MNHAQMEAFQYLVNKANELFPLTRNLKNNHFDLVFSYQDHLFTGDFYQSSTMPSGIQYFEEQINDHGYHWFKETEITYSYLIYKLISGELGEKFHTQYLGELNLTRSDIFFKEIFDFVHDLEGDPVTPFVYNVKGYNSELELPFLMPESDAVFTPITLITTTTSKS